MNDQFYKDIKKHIDKTNIGELSPGSASRRYEPVSGLRKHNEKIHRESKIADKYKNLPFSFSAPKKSPAPRLVACDNCGYTAVANKNTVGMICPQCKEFSKVSLVDYNE